ncbi:uncharacterized protein DMAD_04066 [Drosophila madeirensis]|uniref:Uncharacterized protein n=1 Tax=Drosophila madeirensis TaxID=30013 RepID=A0AAU9GCJ5_DROMD
MQNEIAIERVSKDMENPSAGIWQPNGTATRPSSWLDMRLRPDGDADADADAGPVPSLQVKLSTLTWPAVGGSKAAEGAAGTARDECGMWMYVGVTQRNPVACVTEM